MREELHRLDIGVRVNNPPGHDRTRIGLQFRDLAETRDKPAQHKAIDHGPEDERQGEARVCRRNERQG